MTVSKSFTHTALSIKGAKFASSDEILIAGNCKNSSNEVGHLQLIEAHNGAHGSGFEFRKKAEINSKDFFTDLEICNWDSCAVAAVAGVNSITQQGRISIIRSTIASEATLSSSHDLGRFHQSLIGVNSLSYCTTNNLLASSTESGTVSIWNIGNAEVPVQEFVSDIAGANRVQFTRSSQLITLGSSIATPIRVWDIREVRKVPVMSFQRPSPSSIKRTATLESVTDNRNARRNELRSFPAYTSVCSHLTSSLIVCGSENGDIVVWDQRGSSSSPVEVFSPHFGSTIHSLEPHPADYNAFFSASADGTVKMTKFDATDSSSGSGANPTLQRAVIPPSSSSSMAATVTPAASAFIEEISGEFTTLDSMHSSGVLLAGSSSGSLWKAQFW